MRLCIEKARIPRKLFIDTFPGQETDLKWLDNLISKNAKKLDMTRIDEHSEEIYRLQNRLASFEAEYGLSISEIKDINRKMSIGEAKARRAKKEMVEANLRLVNSQPMRPGGLDKPLPVQSQIRHELFVFLCI